MKNQTKTKNGTGKDDMIQKALEQHYDLVKPQKLLRTILSGKMVMGADFSQGMPVVVTPQNAFVYRKEKNTLEVFTGKTVPGTVSKKDLIINRELHFSTDCAETKGLLREYIEKYMLCNYDFFYVPPAYEINKIIYPPIPIPHLVMSIVREYLY